MRTLKTTMIVMCVICRSLLLDRAGDGSGGRDLGRETLAPNDGWASQGAGTTGGAAAAPDHVYTVHNRQELVAALNDGVYPPPSSTPSNTPKIIYVDGTIDANVDDNNQPLTCQDYYRNGYTLEAFLAFYDPAVWGSRCRADRSAGDRSRRLAGGPEGARADRGGLQHDHRRGRQECADSRRVARSPGLLETNQRSNIIIRNITFQDTFDCFPAWSPTDGALGSWNAEYDAISLRQTHHVWIDHNTFEDKDTHRQH